MKISHGKGDLIKHCGTAKHQNYVKAAIGQKSLSGMFSSQRKGMDIETKTKEAEIRIAGFIAEHNLPFKLMDHLPALMTSVCSDSEIGKKIRCGRTKLKAIITNVSGESERERVINLLKSNNI